MDAQIVAQLSRRIRRRRSVGAALAAEVAAALRDQIVAGRLDAGQKLRNEVELARLLGISRPTLREAVRILIHEGLVVSQHGIGTFVAGTLPRVMRGQLDRMRSLTDLIRSVGASAGVKDLAVERVVPPEEVSDALAIGPRTETALITRTRLADGRPLSRAEEYVVLAEAGDYARIQRFDGGSLYAFLAVSLGRPLAHSNMTITAVAADRQTACHLDLPKGSPLLLMRETTYGVDGRPVLFAVNNHNANVIEFTLLRSGLAT